jgi:hypothetical protein
MGHDRLLAVELDPISQVKLLRLRIVVSRHLFSQEFYQKRAVRKIVRRKTKRSQQHFRRMHFGGRGIRIEVPDNHALDLGPRLGATFDGLQY